MYDSYTLMDTTRGAAPALRRQCKRALNKKVRREGAIATRAALDEMELDMHLDWEEDRLLWAELYASERELEMNNWCWYQASQEPEPVWDEDEYDDFEDDWWFLRQEVA